MQNNARKIIISQSFDEKKELSYVTRKKLVDIIITSLLDWNVSEQP